ncbi:hypothetical protein D3C71_2098550 [compost metagenome]
MVEQKCAKLPFFLGSPREHLVFIGDTRKINVKSSKTLYRKGSLHIWMIMLNISGFVGLNAGDSMMQPF